MSTTITTNDYKIIPANCFSTNHRNSAYRSSYSYFPSTGHRRYPEMNSIAKNRPVPPVPPPKPKNFQLHGPPAPNSGNFTTAKIGLVPGFPPPPPADSDTDSGICADSDNQLSPRRGSQPNGSNSSHSSSLLTPTEIDSPKQNKSYREYLTPNSTRRPFDSTGARRSSNSKSSQISAPFSRQGKQHHRVRFADEELSTGSTASTSSEQSIVDQLNGEISPNSKSNINDNFLNQKNINDNYSQSNINDNYSHNNINDNYSQNNINNNYSAYYFELKQEPEESADTQPYFNQRYNNNNNNYNNVNRSGNSQQRQLHRTYDHQHQHQHQQHQHQQQHRDYSRREDVFSVEDMESIPCPPSYALACSRIRQSRRDSAPPSAFQQRSYGIRSTSLPRKNNRDAFEVYPADVFSSSLSSSGRYRTAESYDQQPRQPRLRDIRDQLAKSMDNLTTISPRGRRRLPTLPGMLGSCNNLNTTEHHRQLPVGSCNNLNTTEHQRQLPLAPGLNEQGNTGQRQPAFSRQRRCRRGTAESAVQSRRSQSLGRTPSNGRTPSTGRTPSSIENHYTDSTNYSPALSRSTQSPQPPVRAQLIALDHRGFRTVLIEKLQPGPFGFYIATGMLDQKRGIYISRVSIPSLVPVLSVGDEILYVDDELVKGRSLEYVQSLIAGKSTVVVTLLPTIGGGSGLC